MKFVVSLLLLSAVAMPVAHADFSGTWKGTGTLTEINQPPLPCSEISYVISQSNSALRIRYGYVNCEPFAQTVQPIHYRIYAGHLVYNGQTVGTIQSTPNSEDATAQFELLDSFGNRHLVHAVVTGDTVEISHQLTSYDKQWHLNASLNRVD